MQVFNAWYSFSPYVADYEREQPWLQHTVKTSIYPLIGILQTSEKANSSIDGEYGTVVAGLIASSMIGAIYFWPFAISVRRVRTSPFNYKLALSMIAVVSVGIIASLAAGNEYTLMASTSLFVLTLISVSAVLSAKLIITVFHTATQTYLAAFITYSTISINAYVRSDDDTYDSTSDSWAILWTVSIPHFKCKGDTLYKEESKKSTKLTFNNTDTTRPDIPSSLLWILSGYS